MRRVLSGKSDAAVVFRDLCALLESLGFAKRIRGGHHLFRRADIEEKINLQRDAIRQNRIKFVRFEPYF